MKIVVCGGRDYPSSAHVWRVLDVVHAETPITDLMQGGCPTGADRFAKEWALSKPGVRRWVCNADWAKHGRAAGPRRNARMTEWKPDLVVALPGGRGTADMVARSRAAGIPVREVEPATISTYPCRP